MNEIVKTNRIIYTASDFAKDSLIYLQEVGQSTSLKKHTSSRQYLDSFLFFIVIDGYGTLFYNNKIYNLKRNDIVFIDCQNTYSHTSDNWTIKWIHINGNKLKNIYNKYISRDGKIVFNSPSFNIYNSKLDEMFSIAKDSDYICDMRLYESIASLLTLTMSETIYETSSNKNTIYNIEEIKKYIDDNYLTDITLDKISSMYFINKFYLTRLFKEKYSTTIIDYITQKRITKAKELLRFTDLSIEDISLQCNIKDPNYFSRVFKKIEGISPNKYKKIW